MLVDSCSHRCKHKLPCDAIGVCRVAAWLLKLVSALDLQKHYLPVAEFEPQLWFPPFPASAYHEMISAQEEACATDYVAVACHWSCRFTVDRSFDPRRQVDKSCHWVCAVVIAEMYARSSCSTVGLAWLHLVIVSPAKALNRTE